MKFLITFACGLACLSALSAAPPTDEEMKEMHKTAAECIAETGVDPALLESVKKGEAVDDEKIHCFGACMMKHMGIMDEAGNVDKDAAIAHIRDSGLQAKAKEVFEACAEEKGDNDCATAGLIFKCLHEKKGADLFHM